MANRWGYPDLGFGIGLRSVHYEHVLNNKPPIDWFEILSENYMDTGGRPLRVLDQVAEHYPVVLHGVSLSVGSTDPVDFEYLKKLKALGKRINARWMSDHLCWTGVAGHNTHDLLPMPYTNEALKHTIERVKIIQDFMERPIALENASTYLEFSASTWHEADFIRELTEQADCGILLDVNNVYVSSFNHGFDPKAYLDKIPRDRVVQMHLAGHTNKGTHILDTHSDYVIDSVWELYRYAHRRLGGVSTLLEWDANIPDFDVVHGEALKARQFREQEDLKLPAPVKDGVPAYGD
ncbi:MAG TPA: DUF692 domain-containing protein [Bryobacteraceae bacterium]